MNCPPDAPPAASADANSSLPQLRSHPSAASIASSTESSGDSGDKAKAAAAAASAANAASNAAAAAVDDSDEIPISRGIVSGPSNQGCQMAIAGFLYGICLALWA